MRCMSTLRCRLSVLCLVPCGKLARNCVRSPVRSGSLVARMPLPGVARWLWKRTRHGFFVDLTSSVVISFGILSNMANFKLSLEACHVRSGTSFWSQSLRGCHRPPPALRKASASKRLGNRASAAVVAKAAGGSGARRRQGTVSYTASVYLFKHIHSVACCFGGPVR